MDGLHRALEGVVHVNSAKVGSCVRNSEKKEEYDAVQKLLSIENQTKKANEQYPTIFCFDKKANTISSLTNRSRRYGLLNGDTLKGINGRKDDGSDRARLNRLGQTSLLVGPTAGVDVKEHIDAV